MMEYAGKSNEELASAFIVSTCRLLPKSLPVLSDQMHDVSASWSSVSKAYSICCGSAEEFYIRPLNPCIDDTDSLVAEADELAFSSEIFKLPSDLSGLSDTLECYKIESYQKYPGFVRLRALGIMEFNWRDKKYELNYIARTYSYMSPDMNIMAKWYCHCTSVRSALSSIISGPAIKRQEEKPGYIAQSDVVYSVWCPQWPKEAQAWLRRPRNNGWPTFDTISEILQNGCHVVYVQHRSCRDDKRQWRFSFSFAEVILIQSWTQIQQIVYHLLRFFAKRELIQKDCPKEDEVLCTYHLKTLMLWTCEEMTPEWWNSSSVITICCELLQKLSEWLKKIHCPNYFIPEANLFHQPSSHTVFDKTEKRLNEFRESSSLCDWFVENYILSFIRRHTKMTSTIDSMPHFVNYILPLFEIWKERESESLDFLFSSTFKYYHRDSRSVIKRGFISGLREIFKVGNHSRSLQLKTNIELADLPTIQNVSCFTYYDIVLHILHAAYGLGSGEISWDSSLFVEVVRTIFSIQPKNVRSEYHYFPKAYTAQSSQFEFLRAQHLMENLTGSNSRSEFQLLSLMSKEFLRRALKYEVSKFSGIAHAVFSYLAALHFATSEYQQAIRFCSAVLAEPTSLKDNETVNAGCLLFIDDVARIVGFCVLHKKITENNLHFINRRLYLDLRLSPEVFAHYIYVLSHQKTTNFEFCHDLPESAFSMDEYLKSSLKPQCSVSRMSNFNAVRQIVCRRTYWLTETELPSMNPLIVKETVIDVLMVYALENMASFHSVFHKDFGLQCNTADCYRALYLYKCRQYSEVLHSCERMLTEPDLQSYLKEFSFANVLVIPPLDSFFDRDVQSLLGFHTLFYYLSTPNDHVGKVNLSDDSTFEHCFARHVFYNKCELSFLLQYNYSIKCHYFLGRHFLARYLKVRCFIDCNLPCTEALTEFTAQETSLPFEHIIRSFLLRKLRIIEE